MRAFTKRCSTQMAEVVQIPPPQQHAQCVSAQEHWQQRPHLYGHPRKKNELRCGACKT